MSIYRPRDEDFDQFSELEDDLASVSETTVIKALSFLLFFFAIFMPKNKAMKTNSM